MIEILCPETGLQVYGSKTSCNKAISDHKTEAAYECRFCGWFHISAKEHCPVTGKRAFLSERAALAHVEAAWTNSDYTNQHGRMPRRAYKCEHCPWWHLTAYTQTHYPGEHTQPQAATG